MLWLHYPINSRKDFFSPITLNNPIKTCFSNKEYTIKIQTSMTQIKNSSFPIKKDFFKR